MKRTFDDGEIIDEKFETVDRYKEEHPEFESDFVDSLKEQWEENGHLSPKQLDALDNVISGFHMEEDDELDY